MSYSFLPEGQYRGTIQSWQIGQLPNDKATPYLEFLVRVTDNEDDETGDFKPLEKPSIRSVKLWLSDNAIKGTVRTLQALGYSPKTLDEFLEWKAFKHKEVFLNVTHGEYQGKPKENINFARRLAVTDSAVQQAILERVGMAYAALAIAESANNPLTAASEAFAFGANCVDGTEVPA